MKLTLGDISNKEEAPRAVTAAVAQLQVESLRVERWLAAKATTGTMRQPFEAGTPKAKRDTATDVADQINEAAKAAPEFANIAPALVVMFDNKGIVLGRNGTHLMRGQNLAERYPGLLETIFKGKTGSDVWVNRAHKEQLLASYAPVRSTAGKIIGGIAIGTQLDDARLARASSATSGQTLLAGVAVGNKVDLIAKSSEISPEVTKALQSSAAQGTLNQALGTWSGVSVAGVPGDVNANARRLAGYGDGKRAVIVAITKARLVGSFTGLLLPVLGSVIIGIILTLVFAFILDSYISRPISDLEDGLLAIINGETDIRFELDHTVLGGLVFRINSLLNELLDVEEDDTDEEGRTSIAPSSQSFKAALNVDERMASLAVGDVADAGALRDEDPAMYYRRIFEDYVNAKKSLGDPVDHIKFEAFVDRIKSSEQEMSEKHGRPFRYKIEVEGKEIVLIAVPLA